MDLLNNLNTILTQAKDMAGAERVARRMIDTEPTQFDHRLRLARLFDTQGAHEKAEKILREAIALDPNSEERRLLLADFLSARKDHRAAEQALLEAVAQLPHSAKIQFGLAALYLKSGQEEKAREQYALVVKDYKEKPSGLEAKVKLAEMDLASGKQGEAERQVQGKEERERCGPGVSNRVA
jgi:tetratricopeptide (TPR) repeat protein